MYPLLSLLAVFISFNIPLLRALLFIYVSMPIHELGHAVAHLLSGEAAIPLPFLTFPGKWGGIFGIFFSFVFTIVGKELKNSTTNGSTPQREEILERLGYQLEQMQLNLDHFKVVSDGADEAATTTADPMEAAKTS